MSNKEQYFLLKCKLKKRLMELDSLVDDIEKDVIDIYGSFDNMPLVSEYINFILTTKTEMEIKISFNGQPR